ncbi:MAG: Alginate biosynthesis protein AlgA [Candidatus Anoxychlamydiales bacterium]|nr:Alginate biosynthesis protein AlgA [Candidatus Anoxychlamydiales bacterium]
MKVIILAGGQGSRLWPYSKDNFPKQFLRFHKKFSLLQESLLRFKNADFVSEILIITNSKYSDITKQQINGIKINKKIDILIEPSSKNTAPAIVLAIKYLEKKSFLKKDDKILIIPSDHIISPVEKFLDILNQLNNKNFDQIITFGIRPTRPETGYGYIKIGQRIDNLLLKAKSFYEKPQLEDAKKFLFSGDFYWNSGIFLFSKGVFLKEGEKYLGDIFRSYNDSFENFIKNFDNLNSISIDKALLEKTKRIALCPLDISWSDVGSWDSIYDLLEKDKDKNVKIGNVLTIDTKNSLIIGSKKLISTIGLENIIVIETEDTIFLSKKNNSNQTKKLLKKLKNFSLKNNQISKLNFLSVNNNEDKKR